MESLLRVVRSPGLVQLIGEMDISNTDQVRLLLGRVLGPVEVDLSRLGFIDARGLKVLMDAARRSDAAIRLRAIPPHIARMIEILGLDDDGRGRPAETAEGDRVLYLAGWRPGRGRTPKAPSRTVPLSPHDAVVVELRSIPTVAPLRHEQVIEALAASCSRATRSIESRAAVMQRGRAELWMALSQLIEQRACMRSLMEERRDLLRELDRMAGPQPAA